MVKGIASTGVVGLVLLAACAAVGQSRESLPDAPSAVAAQSQRWNAPVEEAGSPLSASGTNVSATNVDIAAGPMRRDEGLVFNGAASRKNPDAAFRKYLSSPAAKRPPNSASGGSLMSRATHAAARTVVTRNQAGKGRLNTSYLLRTLSAVAKDSATTPYWRRHFSDAAGDFGSTLGSDAGMNLWHEFGPGLERVLKSRVPAFVSRIEGRIGRG